MIVLVVMTAVTKKMVVQDVMIVIFKNGTIIRKVTFVRTVQRTVKHVQVCSIVSHVSQDSGEVSVRTAVMVASITLVLKIGDAVVDVRKASFKSFQVANATAMDVLLIAKRVPAPLLALHVSQDTMDLLVSMTARRVLVRYVTGAMDSVHMYVQTINISTQLK